MTEKNILEKFNESRFRAVCEETLHSMEQYQVPGVAVGISFQDQEWSAGFGTTNIEHPLPVDEDTLFQIGSITKTFLATVVMRLVDIGQLELDQPVRTYLPGLKLKDESVAARVTLRHLLTHTGGWVGDYFADCGMGDDAVERIVEQMADLEQLTPLGDVWSYNNSGFYLAGHIIEVITGKSFETALKELLLDPLDLQMSFFFAQDVITHRFVVGHEVIDGQVKVARPWAIGRSAHPAGGIICGVKNLLRYALFIWVMEQLPMAPGC